MHILSSDVILFYFWRVILMGAGITLIGSSAVGAVRLGISDGAAALLVGLVAVANAGARIVAGAVCDRKGMRFLMLWISVAALACEVLLMFSFVIGQGTLFYIMAIVAGFLYGCITILASTYSKERFGREHYSTGLAVLNSTSGVGAFLSMLIVRLTEGSGETGVYLAWSILAVMALGLFGLFRQQEYKLQQKHEPQHTQLQSGIAALPHIVITVAREYGSGGHEIGKALAKALGIPCYDSDLIRKVAQESGYTEHYIAQNEQKIDAEQLFDFYVWSDVLPAQKAGIPMMEQLFHAEEQAIKELAAKESCVIVGRLANFVLKGYPNVLRVFVRADMDVKVQRVMQRDELSASAAEKQIRKVEKERAGHCKYFARADWFDSDNYDIVVNSGKYGIANTVALLLEAKAKIQV
jgi:cytidylate kinase